MRKKTLYTLICIAVAAAIFFISCSAERQDEMATIQFSLKEQVSRTISPDHETLIAAKYHFVFANGPKDMEKTIDVNASGSYRLAGIVPGSYQVTVEALNSDDSVLASTTRRFRFLPGLNNYSLSLDALSGKGTLKVNFTWDQNLFTDNNGQTLVPTVELVLKNQNGESISLGETEITNDYSNGAVVLTKENLPSGSYFLSFTLKNGTEVVTGMVDVARITDGVTTEGTIHLNVDKTIAVEGFVIVDNTAAPIVAHIVPDKTFQEGDKGTSVIFSIAFDYLPLGVEEEDVTVSWYNEDFRIAVNKTSVDFVPLQGRSRITAIVNCSKVGAMGSTSIDYYHPGL